MLRSVSVTVAKFVNDPSEELRSMFSVAESTRLAKAAIRVSFRHEVDACADAAAVLLEQYKPGEALDHWMQKYVDFIVAKRGLAASLYAGGTAFETLPAYFDSRFEPALQSLLDAAVAAGELRTDAGPYDLLRAVSGLCMPTTNGDSASARRLVALLVDGMRYRAVVAGAANDSREGSSR